ncbi:MAG TPA: hypothetical protein VJS87_04955 [Solirubrobacterales bacterium]|nr:hypothetical protein [Solirubrobacterales bacterium]
MHMSLLDILFIAGPGAFGQLYWLLTRSYHCPDCKRRVSEDATACPKCGNALTIRFPD